MSNAVDVAGPGTLADPLATFGGGLAGGPLSVRRVAGLLDAPGCTRRRVIDAAGVALDPLVELLDCPPGRQSPFAHARTRTFTGLCTRDAAQPLVDLVTELLGVPVTGARHVAVAGDTPAERAAATRRELAAALAAGDPEVLLLTDPVLTVGIAGRPVPVEADTLILTTGERVHPVEIRTFARVDGVADPAQVAQAARQMAASVLALREVAAELGAPADRIATGGLLVLPENFSLHPTGTVLDVAPQVRRLRRLLAARLDLTGAVPLPAPVGPDADPAERAAAAHDAASAVGGLAARFGDGCLSCPLFGFCRREHGETGAVARVGTDAANLCGDVPGIAAALELAAGTRAPDGPGEQAVAVGLSRAARALELVT